MKGKQTKTGWFLAVFGVLVSGMLPAQDLSTFENRRQWLLKGLHDARLVADSSTRGKHNLPKACARLWNNPKDTVAINYITNILHHPQQTMFDFPGVALALGRFRHCFTSEQVAVIQKDAERLAKEDKKDGEGFLGHGTENHATMMWTSAYLFGQYFPDAKWANGMTSAQLMAEMKERLRKTFKNVYAKGYTEYLSTTYEITMNFPVAILQEFAQDPEMKAIAEAYLLYKWSLQALNNFEGRTLAPYGRMNTQEDYQPKDPYVTGTLYQNWLYWGWGPNTESVKIQDFTNYWETSYAIYTALSNVIPDAVFFGLAEGKTAPFALKSSASTFGPYAGERARPHMMLRNGYRTQQYAIGSGNFRWVPGGDYADHDANGFNIVWSSTDRFNYLNCFHPYWYSDGDHPDRTPDTWHKGTVSPFQQTAQEQNTAIMLFDIPQKDPWPNQPSKEKWAWRDGHANNLLNWGALRYPKSVDEKVETGGWLFLREGKTYIGIKPLKPYVLHTNLTEKGLEGFNVVKSEGPKTGFIFEVGTEADFGSFQKFVSQLPRNPVSVDWNTMVLTYQNSKGAKIRMQYQPGLPVDADGLARSVPLIWVNGKPEKSADQWPMIESPVIRMDNRLLAIQTGPSTIQVDWTASLPVVKRNPQGTIPRPAK
ncbi:hypothetical protein [Larkinella terrae]|uniref:DUF2264 domain-containing protein n=1 Tax=Larkinella terrae TaxID=2025311 RepID=A0A7K0EF16_9BACT|nr:hypothetical protein [Larkinella terrae]MRS60414.1 hypothetical protein [Larkinella terrae]